MITKYYTTPDGKSIPFTSETITMIGEDECNPDAYYELEITQWPKNTQINIAMYWGDNAMGDGGPPDISCSRRKWKKIPNDQFDRSKIIAEAKRLIFDPLHHE